MLLKGTRKRKKKEEVEDERECFRLRDLEPLM